MPYRHQTRMPALTFPTHLDFSNMQDLSIHWAETAHLWSSFSREQKRAEANLMTLYYNRFRGRRAPSSFLLVSYMVYSGQGVPPDYDGPNEHKLVLADLDTLREEHTKSLDCCTRAWQMTRKVLASLLS